MKKRTVYILIILALALGLTYFFLERKDIKEEAMLDDEVIQLEDPVELPEEATGETGSEEQEELIPAMDFTLENLDGSEVSLSDYRGKIVFLNFWATWCQFCDLEMPDLERLNNENDDMVVLAVNLREGKKEVKNYIEKGGYTFDVVMDPKGNVGGDYYVSGLPATYFIDPEGNVRGVYQGMMAYDQMLEALDVMRGF